LKVELKETGTWKRALHIEIPADEVLEEMKQVVKEFRRKASLPGFRKGKVPESMLENRFGSHLEEELLERIIPKGYQAALEDVKLDPIAPPQIKDFSYKKGEPLTFVAHVEVRPVVELPSLDDIKLTKTIYEIEDGAIDQVIDQIRDANPDYVTVDREAILTDRLDVTLLDPSKGADGEPEALQIVLGSEGLIREFEDALVGARAGSAREVELTYPAEMEDKELAGQTKRFQIKVLEVGEKKLRTVDDEFVKTIGFENVEDLRSRIRIRLESEELVRSDRELENALIQRVIERGPFEAPDVMVQNLLDNLIRDLNVPDEKQEEFNERQRPAAVMAVQRMLIIDAVAKRENLAISEDEVAALIRESVEDESKRDRAVAEAKKDGRFNRFRHEMEERKALDFLLEKAEVEEVKTSRPSGKIQTPS